MEQYGINCPSGDFTNCGTQHVARSEAAEAVAEGDRSRLVTNGNIFRNGVKRGLYFGSGSRGVGPKNYVDNSAFPGAT